MLLSSGRGQHSDTGPLDKSSLLAYLAPDFFDLRYFRCVHVTVGVVVLTATEAYGMNRCVEVGPLVYVVETPLEVGTGTTG